MTSPALRQLIADLSLYRDLYVERERERERSRDLYDDIGSAETDSLDWI